MSKIRDLDTALGAIADGVMLAVPADYAGVAMAATRALLRRGVKRLHVITLPTSSLQADLLVGAGSVATIETAAVGFGELGPAPRFGAAVLAGEVAIKDATCPALHAALQASEKGNPFAPLRGIVGSDLLRERPDWRVIDNPFATNDPIVLLPAIRPDVALFHAPLADRAGNVWVGRQRDLFTLAHASAKSVATVERLHDGDLLDDDVMAAATIPAFYLDAVAVAPRGAWPLRCGTLYPDDTAHLRDYLRRAATEAGFRRYLDEHVFGRQVAA
ncbi:MAG TPA: CoA-transferase [Xanthobacteraceae bacterium]|nr:CoA-transferase [Xanthobacteraceae bacterium]